MRNGYALRVALGASVGLALGVLGAVIVPPLLVPGDQALGTRLDVPEVPAPILDFASSGAANRPLAGSDDDIITENATVGGPSFDAVRLEPDGTGLVAGRAEPGAVVAVLTDDAVATEATADPDGRFVAFLDLPSSSDPRTLSLRDGRGATSAETVILSPTEQPVSDATAGAAEEGPLTADPDVTGHTTTAEDGAADLDADMLPTPPPDPGPALRPQETIAVPPLVDPVALATAAAVGSAPQPQTDQAAATAPASTPGPAVDHNALARAVGEPDPVAAPPFAMGAGELAEIATPPDDGSAAPPTPPAPQELGEPVWTNLVEPPDMAEEPGDGVVGGADRSANFGSPAQPDPVAEPAAPPPLAQDVAAQEQTLLPRPAPGAPPRPSGPGDMEGLTTPPDPLAGPAAAPDSAPEAGTAPDVTEAPPSAPAYQGPSAPGQAAVLLSDAQGVRVLQPALPPGADPEVLATVALDAIAYDGDGEVLLSGRGTVGDSVRIYLDNWPIAEALVSPHGTWSAALTDAEPGVYTLRLDQVDGEGQVVSRIETPFQRERRGDIEAALSESQRLGNGIALQIVQPGNTLWAIARERYGEPLMYVRVFEANRDRIRNPDLIYPGQVFVLPEAGGP